MLLRSIIILEIPPWVPNIEIYSFEVIPSLSFLLHPTNTGSLMSHRSCPVVFGRVKIFKVESHIIFDLQFVYKASRGYDTTLYHVLYLNLFIIL